MKRNVDIERIEKPKRVFKNPTIKNEFLELYKDPRWQKKRLEVMQRDEFMCKSCNDKDTTLNVHHSVPYRKGAKPWDYETDELITLCEDCHSQISEAVYYCTAIIMGRCYSTDTATIMMLIMNELDDMNPYQLEAVHKIIVEAKKL